MFSASIKVHEKIWNMSSQRRWLNRLALRIVRPRVRIVATPVPAHVSAYGFRQSESILAKNVYRLDVRGLGNKNKHSQEDPNERWSCPW